MRHTLRSLKYRNFRLYFFGMLVSMTGTWMQIMALMWLVYRLTHSALMLGLVGFAGSAPALVLGIFGSIAADRWGRWRLLLATQVLCFLQALALALLTLTGAIQIWQIFVLSIFLGTVTVFDLPARQAFVADLVDKPDLVNAVALNSSLINISRMAGPTLAGFLVSFYGEGVCFLLNALSYLAVILSLMLMQSRARARLPHATERPWRYVQEGMSYAFGRADMRAMLTLLAWISLAGVPFLNFVPVFSDQVFAAGARGAGLLLGALGVGALFGSLFLARREGPGGLPRLAGLAASGFGAGLGLLALTRRLEVGIAVMALLGWSMMTAFASCNTLLQTLSDEDMRGRVMGLYTLTFMGTAPAGNLLMGAAAQAMGPSLAVALGGAICLGSCWFYFRRLPAFPSGGQ